MLYYVKLVKMQLKHTHTHRFVHCMEKMLFIENIQSGLQTFVPEISHWRMLPSQIDHLKGMESISRSGVSDSLWPPWTVALQATLSMGFSRQEYWSVLPFPSSGDLSDSGIEPGSPALWADSLLSEPPGKPLHISGKILSWPYFCMWFCT